MSAPTNTQQKPSTKLIDGSELTRAALANRFGPSFSEQGRHKKGVRDDTTVVPHMSPAIKSGEVLLTSSGAIDERCAAVRRGALVVDAADGRISGEFVNNKMVSLNHKDAAHVMGFQFAAVLSVVPCLDFFSWVL